VALCGGGRRPSALAASLVGKQQAAELGSDEPQADLAPGQLVEQTWQFPGGEVGIPGAEDAERVELEFVVKPVRGVRPGCCR